jgi:hypothetical protein
VRAENPIHGSDQQSCSTSRLTVTITGHVPTVRLPCHHAGDHVAAAVPARGGMADRRDLDPASPALCPATAAAAPPPPDLGGPGAARSLAQRDTEARRQGLRLLVTSDTILRWHRDVVRRRRSARSKRGSRDVDGVVEHRPDTTVPQPSSSSIEVDFSQTRPALSPITVGVRLLRDDPATDGDGSMVTLAIYLSGEDFTQPGWEVHRASRPESR